MARGVRVRCSDIWRFLRLYAHGYRHRADAWVQAVENFRMPYVSQSVVEFWRRWHITLSFFLRDYLHSVGRNRSGFLRTQINVPTMLLGGLWHGASWNFVLWGGLHGSAIVWNHAWERWFSPRLPRARWWRTAQAPGCLVADSAVCADGGSRSDLRTCGTSVLCCLRDYEWSNWYTVVQYPEVLTLAAVAVWHIAYLCRFRDNMLRVMPERWIYTLEMTAMPHCQLCSRRL